MKLTNQFSSYESEHTLFMKQFKDKTPGMEERQREGRDLLWDKAPRSLNDQDRQLESSVKQQPYVYQNKL